MKILLFRDFFKCFLFIKIFILVLLIGVTLSAQNIREQINNAQTTGELMSIFTNSPDNAYVRIVVPTYL